MIGALNRKTYTAAFMKASNSSVVRCREKRFNWKKTENDKNIFFKAPSVNIEANQACQRTTKLFMDDLLSNGLHEKVLICFSK